MAHRERQAAPGAGNHSLLDEYATAGQLALEVVHEIRNPLEALGYLNHLALEDADDPQQVRKYLRLAQEQVATLARIATQTLTFARASSAPQSIDLVELAEAALRIHQRTIDGKKIHLIRDLETDLRAEIHGNRMLQVISNLILNALEALPDSGTLSLRFRKRNDRIHMIVADNGHGIPSEQVGRVFEQYFSTKGAQGNGLGLHLSKRIVEDHHGTIGLRSCVRPGRCGTAFKISIPA